MKTIITVTALAALVIASPASAQMSDDSKRKMCATYGLIGQMFMEWRLEDVSLSEALERNDTIATSLEQRHLLNSMIIEAYERPRAKTESDQLNQVEQFGTYVEITCLKDKGYLR